jgi:hypothetical protein
LLASGRYPQEISDPRAEILKETDVYSIEIKRVIATYI